MFFLEDLYASKRPSAADWRSAVGRHPRSLRRNPTPETSTAREPSSSSAEHHDKPSSVKRNSLFSRRPKSSATTISSADASSQSRHSSALSTGGDAVSHRSSMADMAVSDGEGLKSKLLFGRHYRKKSASGKPRPMSPLDLYDESAESKKDRSRERHKRGASIGCKDFPRVSCSIVLTLRQPMISKSLGYLLPLASSISQKLSALRNSLTKMNSFPRRKHSPRDSNRSLTLLRRSSSPVLQDEMAAPKNDHLL
jgi:hypothetical protein